MFFVAFFVLTNIGYLAVYLNILLPYLSIATINGKLSNSSFFIDSQPKSSKAITSHFFICCAARAPAPPIAHRYTDLFFEMEFITSSLR